MNTPPVILVVEDEEPLRSVLVQKLVMEGFTAYTAKNGEEGIEAVKQYNPDLILLDVVMPHMDGMTMLKTLREKEGRKDIKIIMLTNLGDTDKVAESLDHGVYDYLVKSDWKLEDVIAKVHAVLAKA